MFSGVFSSLSCIRSLSLTVLFFMVLRWLVGEQTYLHFVQLVFTAYNQMTAHVQTTKARHSHTE
jgi:hypothetical protein